MSLYIYLHKDDSLIDEQLQCTQITEYHVHDKKEKHTNPERRKF